MMIPREKPKTSFLKRLISPLIAIVFSLLVSLISGWMLTQIYPVINPIVNGLINISLTLPNRDIINQEIINQAIRVAGAFLIGLVISAGISAVINLAFRKRTV